MTNINTNDPKWCIIGQSDPFLARLIHRFAEKYDLQIQHARTGEDVMELIDRFAPVLIILELEIPGKLRGWDVTKRLKGNPQTNSIPLILCSWLNRLDALALSGEVSAFLQLPGVNYNEFAEALKITGIKIEI